MSVTANNQHPDNDPRRRMWPMLLVAFCFIGVVCIIGDVLNIMPKSVQGVVLLLAAAGLYKLI